MNINNVTLARSFDIGRFRSVSRLVVGQDGVDEVEIKSGVVKVTLSGGDTVCTPVSNVISFVEVQEKK